MLKEYLQSYFQDEELRHIFKDVVGTEDAISIQIEIEKALNNFGFGKAEKVFFIQSSIGVVFGLLLSSRQSLTLKIYSGKISQRYLEKMNEIQTLFYQEKFPAPKVLSPIFSFGNTHAGFYELIEGTKADAHQPKVRNELAKYLARFADVVDKHQLPAMENFFQQAMAKKLWPSSHNVLFNIKKTSRGAGWIAQKAREARKILNASFLPKKLAHTDWGVKNAIFNQQRLVGVFDWDSLGAMSEVEMVGRAAAQFTADWESDYKITPSAEEGRDFVSIYEECRKKAFSQEELKLVSASADYLIAIIARFEHAGGGESHPYQDLLRASEGNSFLEN